MFPFDVILFDVGGVLLTNGWDHRERALVVDQFQLDRAEFERRHPEACMVVASVSKRLAGFERVLDPGQVSALAGPSRMKLLRSRSSIACSSTVSMMSVSPPDSTSASASATTRSCSVARPRRWKPSRRHLHRELAARPRQHEFGRLRRLVAVDHRQRPRLRVGEQPVAVHGDAVARAAGTAAPSPRPPISRRSRC